MRASYFGNSWLGMFVACNSSFALIPVDASKKFEEAVRGALRVKETVRLTIASSNLIGIYLTMNDNGIVVSDLIEEKELECLKELGLNIHLSSSVHNAHGNNLCVNNKGGVINPHIKEEEKKKVEDVLGVELTAVHVARYAAVGSCLLANDRGVMVHFKCSEEELENIKNAFGVYGNKGTLNMGSGFVGKCAVANNNGYVAGEQSSPFELGRLEECLDFVER